MPSTLTWLSLAMAILSTRRKILTVCISCGIVLFLYSQWPVVDSERFRQPTPLPPALPKIDLNDGKFHWANVRQHYPVTSLRALPEQTHRKVPKIQFAFGTESPKAREERLRRQHVVKDHFTHAFRGYKKFAWLRDEVAPLSGHAFNPFGGWAATLVDSLDTLWIMGMTDEFAHAVEALNQIDFSTCSLDELNVFETTIRYLGGFLSAYDLSKGQYPSLLTKAIEMGDMLYMAFDTPNRMPITRWDFKAAARGDAQVAPEGILVAELGSLTLEFTRLSQLSGDPKYYDAVQRVMDVFETQQNATKLPGMWPVVVNAKDLDLTQATGFTIGGMADSAYEYLPKQYLLLGGAADQYRRMYEGAIRAIKQNILYRPMTPDDLDILVAGQVSSDGSVPPENLTTEPQAQHLGCFAGGMLALASKVFNNREDLVDARKLVEGCLWAYEALPLGIMPEIMHLVPCDDRNNCTWDEKIWKDAIVSSYPDKKSPEQWIQTERLVPGVIIIDDRRYILRPEAIESVFILYRITGDQSLPDRAWNMFNAIVSNTKTNIAHAALDDCTIINPPKSDRMESFWMAETLKYFYLIFSEPSLVSLDEYVLNTEAHPLRRP